MKVNGPKPVPWQERIWKYVKKTGYCWLWTASLDAKGYGQFQRSRKDPETATLGRGMRAHRAIYELSVGQIPNGLDLDHLCRNRACVNPEHLEPVTTKVNLLRGESPMADNARKTHCIHGHEFTEENTRHSLKADGMVHRCCRACDRRYANNRRRRQGIPQGTKRVHETEPKVVAA